MEYIFENAILKLDDLSEDEFLYNPGHFKHPFIINNYASKWPAFKKWTPEFFSNTYGNLPVTVQSGLDNSIRNMLISEYFNYYIQNKEDGHYYYLKNWVFESDIPDLIQDYTVPTFFQSWTEEMPSDNKPKLRWLYIGPKGSGSELHLDVVNSSAWNAVFTGKKIWHFFHPDDIKYLYDLKVDTFNADLSKYPLYTKAKPLVCVQNPGDIVYTPGGWPHQVINIESCISLTENFINQSNYTLVLDYLEQAQRTEEAFLLKDLVREKKKSI
jgi:histone arginine demethylase JMJD6